ncbi:hypothetical protein D3C86_1683270 [compost metagenome]
MAEVDLQRRFDLAGELFVYLYHYAFFADFHQRAAKFMAGTVEQLHRIALGHAQHATDVMGLGLGQFVLAGAQGGVDKEAGQSHAGSLEKRCNRLKVVSTLSLASQLLQDLWLPQFLCTTSNL